MSTPHWPRLKAGLGLGGWTLLDDGRFTDEVWRVRHEDGRLGVIKTARGKKPPWPERFTPHEVKTMERLQHLPGVLRLLDRDDAATPTWMVTELAEPLVTHLGPEPDLGTVVSAFADIADTLELAAAEGVAHRDIKPDNLFFARGRSLVGDFGLATGHDHPGLTGFGDRVGPANFCAPEALEAHEGINWHAADVYALAKSLWVIVVGDKYPPQGPLLISRRETDLTPHAGLAADDLARLLELATLDQPTYRPQIRGVRDELRIWLQLFPPGTAHEPTSRRYRTLWDEYRSVRAVEKSGRDGIAANAVQQLLDQCRSAGPNSGSVTADPDADIAPRDDPRLHDDQDWSPDHVAVKKLAWDGVGGVRLVAVATLDADDDLRYSITWQLRDQETGR